MIHRHKVLFLMAGLVSTAMFYCGEVFAQCSGGRSGGMSTGSPTSLASSFPYPQNALTSGGYSQPNSLSSQYQQQVLATQSQIANQMYQNAQRQRLAAMEREARALPHRLARAEAGRAKRAEKIAARLREQNQSSEAYKLASIIEE